MSKIICDVCGTSYPETAEQCPICGCVRPANVQGVIADGDSAQNNSGYTYVKGGRFSKANVKKRNRALQSSQIQQDITEDEEPEDKPTGSKGLIITAIVLLLAIVAVIIYITVRILAPADTKPEKKPQVTTEPSVVTTIPCTGIVPVKSEIEITELNGAVLLECTIEPDGATDTPKFSTSDESVVTVNETTGLITAVGPGEATITITCGDQEATCKIICDFEMPTEDVTEEPTEETTEETVDTTYTEADIIFNSPYNPPEVTLRYEGEVWRCYKGNIPIEEITWTIEDENVAKVEDGVVTAVGSGITTLHAIWGDYDVTCKIRCNFIITDTGIAGSGGNIGEG